jgi:hypothetical protein
LEAPLISSIVMMSGIIIYQSLSNSLHPILILLTTVSLGVILYLLTYYIRDKATLVEIKTMLIGGG